MKEQATIQSLQEAIEKTNDGISYAENLIATTAENDVPSPTIGNEVPVEKIIEEITNFGNKRKYMVEETRNFVLPELNAIKERRISAQEKLLEQAGMNFRQALELKAAGVLGETEIQIIEEALARLPEELSERIKNPMPENPEPEPTLDVKKRGIAGIFRRNAVETSAINTVPQTPKYEVTVPDGFESVLHYPIRQIESAAETVGAPTEKVEEPVISAREPEPVEVWEPELFGNPDVEAETLLPVSLIENSGENLEIQAVDASALIDKAEKTSETLAEDAKDSNDFIIPETEEEQYPDYESLEINSERAKEVYHALIKLTFDGNADIKRDDLVKEIFGEELASGKISLEQARGRIKTGMVALREGLSNKSLPVSIDINGKTAGMTYTLLLNGSLPKAAMERPLSKPMQDIIISKGKKNQNAPVIERGFLLTSSGNPFTVTDLAMTYYEEEIKSGGISIGTALDRTRTYIIPALLSSEFLSGHYEKERDGQRMIYRFVHNEPEVSAAKTLDEPPIETARESTQDMGDNQISGRNEALERKPEAAMPPDSENPFKNKPILSKAFDFTKDGRKFSSQELAEYLYERELSLGVITLERAIARVATSTIPTLLHMTIPQGKFEKDREGRNVRYRFVRTESQTAEEQSEEDLNPSIALAPDETESANPFREGTGPRLAYDSLSGSEVALSYSEWAEITYREQLEKGELTLPEAINNLNKIVTRSLRTMDPKFGELIASRRYGDVTRFLLKAPNIAPDLDTDKPEDEENQDLEQSADSENIDEIIPAVDADIEQKSPTLPPRDFHLTPRHAEIDDILRLTEHKDGIANTKIAELMGINENLLKAHLSNYRTLVQKHGYTLLNLTLPKKGSPIYKLIYESQTATAPNTGTVNDPENKLTDDNGNDELEIETENDLDSIEPTADEKTSLQESVSNLDPEKSSTAFIDLDAGVTLDVNHRNGLSEAETVEKKVDEWQETKNEDGSCRHKWIIDTPNGPGGSAGRCGRCGKEKEFQNYIEPNYTDKLPATQQKAIAKGINEIESLIREAERQIY